MPAASDTPRSAGPDAKSVLVEVVRHDPDPRGAVQIVLNDATLDPVTLAWQEAHTPVPLRAS